MLVGGIIAPVIRVSTPLQPVVSDDIIADALETRGGTRVEGIARAVVVRRNEVLDRRLDEVERGRLERLDEALGEPDRDDIRRPRRRQPPDLHREVARRDRTVE